MERDDFPWGWALAGVIALCIIFAILPGKSSDGGQAKTEAVRAGGTVTESSSTASNNQLHLLSDNQVNVMPGTINNCYGVSSCVVISTTATTSISQQGQRVQGDQTIYVSPIDGTKFCQDPATGLMTAAACSQQEN